MIPAELGALLGDAVGALVTAGALPPDAIRLTADGTWRPGPVPAAYATSLPFGLARLAGRPTAAIAAALAEALAPVGWISSAEVTGDGFLTVAVTPAALARVAVTVTEAGPACARSAALRGTTRPAPPLPDLSASVGGGAAASAGLTWRQAWREQSAALAGRIALAAGATVMPVPGGQATAVPVPGAAPRHGPGPAPRHGPGRAPRHGPGRALGTGIAADPSSAAGPSVAGQGPASPGPAPRGDLAPPPALASAAAPGRAGLAPAASASGNPAPAPAGTGTVADAVSYLGPEPVRYWLARLPASRAGHLPGAGRVPPKKTPPYRNGPFSDPPELVRDYDTVAYGTASAAAVLRRAAALGLERGGPPDPADLACPAETALLAALSWLAERVAAAARRGEPAALPRYLEHLAVAWATCREECPALPDGGRAAPATAAGVSARLWLAAATRAALAAGLDLVGITAAGMPGSQVL